MEEGNDVIILKISKKCNNMQMSLLSKYSALINMQIIYVVSTAD